jgi:hypothetical protein
VFQLGGRDALGYVAPVVGIVFVFAFLSCCDALFARGAAAGAMPAIKRLCCLSLLAASWHLLFTRGYVENTQLGLPFLLLAVADFARYPAAANGRAARRAFVAGSAWLAVASLFHGESLALLPALPLIAWLFPPKARAPVARAGDVGLGLLAIVLATAVAVAALAGLGFYVYPGTLHWGMLVALGAPAPGAATSLAPEHIRSVGNILLLASPLALLAPLSLAHRAGRRGPGPVGLAHPFLVVLALGYCGFTWVFRFELGFPRDFDLMLSLALLLHLHLLQVAFPLLESRSGRWLLGIVLVAGATLSWSVHGALLVPADAERVAAYDLSHAPVLLANGHARELHLRAGEGLILEVRRPPGGQAKAPFALYYATGRELTEGPFPITAVARALRGEPSPALVTDNLHEHAVSALVRSEPAPWASEPVDVPHAGGITVLQGVIEDARGVLVPTNAVIVHWP